MDFAVDLKGEFYNLEKVVKLVKNDNIYRATFEIPIRLNEYKNDTYIQKEFKDLKVPEYFFEVDDKLFLNVNKILKITFFDDYALLTSNTKKKIGGVYLNYNIKISNQNKKILEYIKTKGVEMNGDWIQIGETLINLENVTNIYFDDDKVIINFVNSATNKSNLVDIKPEYEIQFMDETQKNGLKNLLEHYGMVKIGEKFINLKNIYNVKLFRDNNVCFINFVSNISKVVNDRKVISTEFVKYEADSEEEFNEFLGKIGIK